MKKDIYVVFSILLSLYHLTFGSRGTLLKQDITAGLDWLKKYLEKGQPITQHPKGWYDPWSCEYGLVRVFICPVPP